MEGRGWIRRHGFWPLALLWLPAGIAAQAAVRFPPDGPPGDPMLWPAMLTAAGSLLPVAPCDLPLALGCRRLWRLRHKRAGWLARIGLGAVTVTVSPAAGLPGPVAIAVCAVAPGLAVWGPGIGLRGADDSGRRAGCAAYASSRPAISDIRRAIISGSRSEKGRKPNRS